MIEKLKKIWQNETLNKYTKFLINCFSFKGVYDLTQIWFALLVAQMINSTCRNIGNETLMTIGTFTYAYIMLASVQKRCRDFGSKGTFEILIVSTYLMYWGILHPSGMDLHGIFHPISIVLMSIFILTMLFVIFYPSNDKKNLELTSPLLKYPRLYFALGVVLVLAGRYVVETYYL